MQNATSTALAYIGACARRFLEDDRRINFNRSGVETAAKALRALPHLGPGYAIGGRGYALFCLHLIMGSAAAEEADIIAKHLKYQDIHPSPTSACSTRASLTVSVDHSTKSSPKVTRHSPLAKHGFTPTVSVHHSGSYPRSMLHCSQELSGA